MNEELKKTLEHLDYKLFALFLVFLILKLTGVINWSWWWVFSPMWIDLGLSLIILIVLVGYNAYQEYKGKNNKWRF